MFSRNTNNLSTKKCTTQFELEELGIKYAITDLNVFRDHCLVDNSVPPNKSNTSGIDICRFSHLKTLVSF